MKTLRPYQELSYIKGLEQNLLNADDRGLGKTVTSIETARVLMERMNAPSLIVVPKTLVPQWCAEIEDQDQLAPIVVVDASTAIPRPFNSQKAFWVVTHYEAMVKHQKVLARTFWAVVIADEAHRIKNRKAQRSTALKKLRAYRKLALTGTPYDRNPADIWSILNWLRPEIFRSYWAFFEAHVDFDGQIDGVKNIKGVKDGAKFARATAPYLVQRLKADVAPQLPKKIQQYIPVQMPRKQADLYERIQEIAEMDLQLDTGETILVKNVLGRILRLQQAASDPRLLGTDENGAKIDWLLEYVDDNPGDTLLIFTRFRDTAIRVANMLQIPFYVGGSNAPANGFEAYPRMVATIDAAKEGLNLGHIWNTVFLDQHWSSIAMAQAMDRTERDLEAAQPRMIMYLQAVAANGSETVDALVRRALSAKWSTIDLVNGYLRAQQNASDQAALQDIAIEDAKKLGGF
jgi:hypothetical protein